MVIILVNCFGKHLFSILCHKNIDVKEAAQLYIHYVYWIYKLPDTIVSNYRPQFILVFWNEFIWILGIRLKLFTAYHSQTDGQTKIIN